SSDVCSSDLSLFFITPILQNLAGQFHKIPINTCSRKTRVVGVCKHSVQCVTKLVEQSCDFIKSQKRRFARSWFCEIANNGNMWAVIYSVLNLLRFIGSHPRAISLSSTRVEVCVKDGNQFSFVVFYFVCFYVCVVFIDVLHFFKMEAVEFFRNGKNS